MDEGAWLAKFVRQEQDRSDRLHHIRETILAESAALDGPNFSRIAAADLRRLFHLYDEQFFGRELDRLVKKHPDQSLGFRLSGKMTRAAGKTYMYRRRGIRGETVDLEIAISTALLFETFRDVERPVVVCGLECTTRLDAMLRVFEHELVHLFEMLVWRKSSCSRENFWNFAHGIFGHAGVKHDLITPAERAAKKYSVRVGDRVVFDHNGQRLVGRINRIVQRAVVLVEHPKGVRYTDGKRYLKFYVPPVLLRPVDGEVA